MRTGSLCSGYGGLEIAAEHVTGSGPAWFCEVDPAAAAVFSAHWPSLPNHGDITTVDWENVEPVDVLAGGVPCQGWSLAGRRQGSDDERDLWPVRKHDDEGRPRRGAVDAIRALRPALFLFENVPGILTAERGVPFGTVLADLDDLGYAVSWTVVGACKVGACHHRHRVYLAAVRLGVVGSDTVRPAGDPIAERHGSGWGLSAPTLFGPPEIPSWPQAGAVVGGQVWQRDADPCGAGGVVTTHQLLPTSPARDASRGKGRSFAEGRPLSEVVALLPTPTASDTTGAGHASDGGLNLRTAVVLLPTPRASDADKGGPNQRGSGGDVMLPAAVQPGRFGTYEAAVRRQEHLFGIAAPEPTETGRLGNPRLAPAFPEWMQGLPDGWITKYLDWSDAIQARKDAIRIAGNGVVWQGATYAYPTLPTVVAFLAAAEAVAA